ncbi:uridine kinase [Roseivirga sp. BDSF3-8]|uniref:uridine kinase family protein n=1 Tax=Roseivirga sp. BDSF3-8 TaxID=3241598 RepID=UPI0035323684
MKEGHNPYIVGITGGSASGKTRFLNSLIGKFTSDEVCLISQDNYYRPRHLQPVDENGVQNFDTPHSINHEEYANDIRKLKQGVIVEREEYTFNNPEATPSKLIFKPAPIIVVEGIFVFYYPEVSELLDLKVFIDARDYIKLKRRIIRDRDERGYDLEDVLYRYEKHVAPTFDKYIKPFKYEADVILPNNRDDAFDRSLDMLVTFLRSRI